MGLYEHSLHPHASARKKAGPVRTADHFAYLGKINEMLARRGTLAFGTMWMFYALICYGLLPLLLPHDEVTLLYWSNVIQLVALPLLMVGAVVLGKSADQRAVQQFNDVELILHEQSEQAAHLAAQDEKILAILTQIEANTAMTEQVRDAIGERGGAAGGRVVRGPDASGAGVGSGDGDRGSGEPPAAETAGEPDSAAAGKPPRRGNRNADKDAAGGTGGGRGDG